MGVTFWGVTSLRLTCPHTVLARPFRFPLTAVLTRLSPCSRSHPSWQGRRRGHGRVHHPDNGRHDLHGLALGEDLRDASPHRRAIGRLGENSRDRGWGWQSDPPRGFGLFFLSRSFTSHPPPQLPITRRALLCAPSLACVAAIATHTPLPFLLPCARLRLGRGSAATSAPPTSAATSSWTTPARLSATVPAVSAPATTPCAATVPRAGPRARFRLVRPALCTRRDAFDSRCSPSKPRKISLRHRRDNHRVSPSQNVGRARRREGVGHTHANDTLYADAG